jgi:hypothetical protein
MTLRWLNVKINDKKRKIMTKNGKKWYNVHGEQVKDMNDKMLTQEQFISSFKLSFKQMVEMITKKKENKTDTLEVLEKIIAREQKEKNRNEK